MTYVFYLLLLIGHLGIFDVIYFHHYQCRLAQHPACQREVFYHTCRHLIYALQFLIISSLRFHGLALLLLALVYLFDIVIAWLDVWTENASRQKIGGLPSGEYFMHIVLSLLVGSYLTALALTVWPDRLLATAVVIDPPEVPYILRLYMIGMGIAALGAFFHDLVQWMNFRSSQKTTYEKRP